MHRVNTFKLKACGYSCALTIACLLFSLALSVRAQTPTPAASPSPATSAKPAATPEKMEMEMPGMQMPQATPAPRGDQPAADEQTNMPDMPGMKMKGAGRVSASDPQTLMMMNGERMDIRVGASKLNFINMGQMGSGTSWQPATTPMYMFTKVRDKWLVFIHGEATLGVNAQGGPRGVTKFESTNWIMPMALRRVGQGTLQLRGMFSLEPLTFAPSGTPQLFQTGESYKGAPLVDRQHPHDLFMELSATYTVPLGERATWFAYGGFPGEPALGPVAFMHRGSASENPSAPLAHHLEDSTHISFGVFTTGFTDRWFKLEGSLFNGREPDENRYNFEFHPWNSRSARLSFAPNGNWSMQLSHGFLKSPEALQPEDIRRTTASISYNRRFTRGNFAASLIWGRNHGSHDGERFNLNGYTAESTVNFRDRNYIYTRLELADKNELLLPDEIKRLGMNGRPTFRIGAYTFGAARDLWNTAEFSIALGSDLTFYSKLPALDAIYGNNPISYKLFLRIRPQKQ